MFLIPLIVLLCRPGSSSSAQGTEWTEGDDWEYEMSQKLFPAPQYVDVVFVGDRSGSMDQYRGSSQLGTTEFMQEHRETAQRSAQDETINGVHTHMTVVTFDDRSEVPFSGDATTVTDEDIAACARAMEPRNSTRLFDTAVEEIDAQVERMMAKEDEGYAVHAVFALLTDGQDNGSRRHAGDLRRAIAAHEARGVTCMFVQAGTDALRIGANYGFAGARTLEMGHDEQHARNAIRAVSAQTSDYTRQATLSAVSSTNSRAVTAPAEPDYDRYDRGYDYDDVPPPAPLMSMRSLTTPAPPTFSMLQRQSSAPAERGYDDHDYDDDVPPAAPLGVAYSAPARASTDVPARAPLARVYEDDEEWRVSSAGLTRQ